MYSLQIEFQSLGLHCAGSGRLTLRDGSYYEGSWKDGLRKHGKWVSADRKQEYRGDWVEDRRHGTGTLHIQGLLQYTGKAMQGQGEAFPQSEAP